MCTPFQIVTEFKEHFRYFKGKDPLKATLEVFFNFKTMCFLFILKCTNIPGPETAMERLEAWRLRYRSLQLLFPAQQDTILLCGTT